MLDALKFAFEILIVGALTVPWLAMLNRIFAPDASASRMVYLSVIPRSARAPVAVALVIAFGYVAGSTISRVSKDMFNDETLEKLRMPREDKIRESVYLWEYCEQHLIELNADLPLGDRAPLDASAFDGTATKSDREKLKLLRAVFCSPPNRPAGRRNAGPESKKQRDAWERWEYQRSADIEEMFSLQEGELLLQGQDKVDRLKEYYDQITVLRGAALNGFILFTLSAFGYCGGLRARWGGHAVWRFLALLPAGLLTLYGLWETWWHVLGDRNSQLWHTQLFGTFPMMHLFSDPPLAEFVLVLLGAVGLLVTLKAPGAASYLRTCIAAGVLTSVAFGAWWWTEVMYDLQVVHSQPVLHPIPQAQPETGSSNGQSIFEGMTDIGDVLKGSTAYDPGSGEYRVMGGGADMWGAADHFHMSWTRVSGDAALAADIHFPAGKLAPLEKAVLIFRQSLDPGSPYADVAIHGDGHITLQYRKIAGGKTEDTTSTEHGSARLRIERKGDRFTISAGTEDGKMVASAPITVVLHDPMYVGIGMCAHDADGLAAATFSRVELERSAPSGASRE